MTNFLGIGIFVVSMMMAQAVFAQSSGGESFKDIAFEYVLNNIESIKARPWKVKSTSYDKMPNGDYIVRLTISRTLTLQEEGLVSNQVQAYGTTFNVGVRRGYIYTDFEDSKSYLVFVDRFGKPTRYVGAPENYEFHYWNGNAWLFTNKQNDKSGNKDLDYFYNMICYKNNGEIQWKGLDVNIYGWAYSGKNLYLVGTYHESDIPVIRTINTNSFEYTDKRNACSGIPYHIDFSDEGLIISEYKSNGKTSSFTFPYAASDRQFQIERVLERYDLTKASDLIALGERYLKGRIVDKDEKKAFDCFQKAANTPNDVGLYRMGLCYKDGIGVDINVNNAFHSFEQSANMGNIDAMKALLSLYAAEDGVPNDVKKVLFWTESLAFKGDKAAQQFILSNQSQDYEKANVTAHDAFGMAHESYESKDYEWARFCYERAVSLGSIEGMRNYGKWLLYGGNGLDSDTQKAIDLLEDAANQKDFTAMVTLMNWYEKQKDYKKVVFWGLKVAERGDVDAQILMGKAYREGIGVEKNEAAAFSWYEKAALQGNQSAIETIMTCYINGIGVEKNNTIAIDWYQRLNPEYQLKIADNYSQGIGVKKNKVLAYSMYRRTSLASNQIAIERTMMCCIYGIGVKKDYACALDCFRQLDSKRQCQIADDYWYGNGIKKNRHLAGEMYTYLAKEKKLDFEKMYDITQCYIWGWGIKKDYDAAKSMIGHMWNLVDHYQSPCHSCESKIYYVNGLYNEANKNYNDAIRSYRESTEPEAKERLRVIEYESNHCLLWKHKFK